MHTVIKTLVKIFILFCFIIIIIPIVVYRLSKDDCHTPVSLQLFMIFYYDNMTSIVGKTCMYIYFL